MCFGILLLVFVCTNIDDRDHTCLSDRDSHHNYVSQKSVLLLMLLLLLLPLWLLKQTKLWLWNLLMLLIWLYYDYYIKYYYNCYYYYFYISNSIAINIYNTTTSIGDVTRKNLNKKWLHLQLLQHANETSFTAFIAISITATYDCI